MSPPAGRPAAAPVPPGTRAWFAFFAAWMTALALAAGALLERSAGGQPAALGGWLLALLAFYLSLCNSFVPLPTAWIVLLAAGAEHGPALPDGPRVLLVAGLAALATVIANLNEYHLLAYILRFRLGRRLRGTRVYSWAVRWFDRAPFQLLTLIAFVPLPVDAVRWLAVLRGYSRSRFALAYFAGRGARYLLLGVCAVLLELTPLQIAAIQAALVVAALAARWLRRGRRPLSGRRAGAAAPAETTLAAAAEAGAAGR